MKTAATRGDTELAQLFEEVGALRAEMLANEARLLGRLEGLHGSWAESGRNLLHYLALRQRDRRELQNRLAAVGLSSLGRAEGHALANVEAVLDLLVRVLDVGAERTAMRGAIGRAEGTALLERHTRDLLGPEPQGRNVRVMVTLPSEAADDARLVDDLLEAGANAVRINCAHDAPEVWRRMIDNLRRAREATGRTCRVLMDLGGPKLRTGAIERGAQVVKVKPSRDPFGQVVAPARVWLTPAEHPTAPPSPADASIPVPAAWLARASVGDAIALRDTRGARRRWVVVGSLGSGRWADAVRTAYVAPGTKLALERGDGKKGGAGALEAQVGAFVARESRIVLAVGDTLMLTAEATPGSPALVDEQGRLLRSARIPCTLPEVFSDVRPGERVWLDDGRIGGIVRRADVDGLRIEIVQARPGGERLGADKGINLPDSALSLRCLTEQDEQHLGFVAENADLVGLSFLREAEDVRTVATRLAELRRGAEPPGLVLKIENRRAFQNLPDLLLAAMHFRSAGVMIARGDLAVECGWERLAEVQEEILWLAEAAHVPVIWATQVLESLAKTGVPSRAEITDAAMSTRAECVMLNKGPHVVEAVQVLDDILERMEEHQQKKTPMLRSLSLAQRLG